MQKQITLEEVILEMMPFSKELINWCKAHPKFMVALKNIYPKKFPSPGMIVTSTSPNFPEDEVIGVYTYDYVRGKPIFKQDFIINKGRSNTEFILYTRNPSGSSKYVKDINGFYEKYGKGGYYKNSHHLTLKELSYELQERAKATIRLAVKLKDYDLDNIYAEVQLIKSGQWFVKHKIAKTSDGDSDKVEAKW